jgi:effector-binding domain-containing protein
MTGFFPTSMFDKQTRIDNCSKAMESFTNYSDKRKHHRLVRRCFPYRNNLPSKADYVFYKYFLDGIGSHSSLPDTFFKWRYRKELNKHKLLVGLRRLRAISGETNNEQEGYNKTIEQFEKNKYNNDEQRRAIIRLINDLVSIGYNKNRKLLVGLRRFRHTNKYKKSQEAYNKIIENFEQNNYKNDEERRRAIQEITEMVSKKTAIIQVNG